MRSSAPLAACVYTEAELTAMRKADLLTLAGGLGVDGVGQATLKADIISAILAAQEGCPWTCWRN